MVRFMDTDGRKRGRPVMLMRQFFIQDFNPAILKQHWCRIICGCGGANCSSFFHVGCSDSTASAGVHSKTWRNSGLLGHMGDLVHVLQHLWEWDTATDQTLPAQLHSTTEHLQSCQQSPAATRAHHFSPAAYCFSAQRYRQVDQQSQAGRVEQGKAD